MRRDTVRLTLDFPTTLHTYLKVAAAKEGVSMRAYIVESLIYKMDHDENLDLDMESFRKELSKATKKDSKLMKDLSDK